MLLLMPQLLANRCMTSTLRKRFADGIHTNAVKQHTIL
jgi:hypothetical protein